MLNLTRLLPALALVVVGVGCGSSSPTGPDLAATSALSAPASTGNSSTLDLGASNEFAPPTDCNVHMIELAEVHGSNDRASQELQVILKGDAANCPNPTWYVSPKTRLVVIEKEPTHAIVYDPGDKLGVVEVTATLEPYKVSTTMQVSFERDVR